MSNAKRKAPKGPLLRLLWHRHSLTIVTLTVLATWLILYMYGDPKTHLGAFYGNAIADWSGSLLVILGTKYFMEHGSAESKKGPARLRGLHGLLEEHSLSIFVFVTGCVWAVAFFHMDSNAKWGQVVGNIVSEWVQVLGLIFLTKNLYEVKSKESKAP